METEVVFRYALAPLVRFPKGGILAAQIRDNTRREAKDVVSLADGTAKLVLRIAPASQGKLPSLVTMNAGKEIASATLSKPIPTGQWTPVEIKWDEKEAVVTVGGADVARLELPASFDPKTAALQTSMVDDLRLEGDGSFSLDWENGFAASVTPREEGSDIVVRMFGFDAYVVGQDAAKRDFPMVQVLNGGEKEQEVTFDFEMRGEVSGLSKQWRQKITVPARSGNMLAVEFPAPLGSDIYHMAMTSDVSDAATRKHFISIENRDETAGPAKFGLHDSDRRTFGAWPDTLPIDYCHLYGMWGYIHGPAWLKDPGITENTPPEQWNWDPRIEQAIQQGLTPWVCLVSRPFYSWMREREYESPKMDKRDWATLGGFPNLAAYRKFVKIFAGKYKGQIPFYEVENEPMAYLGGIPPKDYAEISKAVFEEVHAVDPNAKVYGISGTGDFIPWMKEVFQAGGGKFMDGVSIHTYTTPAMPEEAGLEAKIAAFKNVAASGKTMPFFNSETGVFIALREVVDKPIAPARVQELIKQGVTPFSVPTGWPTRTMDEWSGSSSFVRNVVLNFLGGAEAFVFFGWNDKWPVPDWWGNAKEFNGSGFALISASKSGERTPGLHTLAIGVVTAQLKGVRHQEGKPIDEGGILGAIFPKVDGGEVAVLWSPLGKRSALVESADSHLEVVSLLGQTKNVTTSGAEGKHIFRLDVSSEPIYIHAKQSGLQLLASPVANMSQGGSSDFQFNLVNKYKESWEGSVAFTTPAGWSVTPGTAPFNLEPGKRAKIEAACAIPEGTKQGDYTVDVSLKLPDGTPFTFPVSVTVRPKFVVPHTPAGFAWKQPSAWRGITSQLTLDQSEQVTLGRAPQDVSMQEEKYWKGPGELSGIAKVASDGKDLFVFLEVSDANQREPENWPGVLGSSVEIFLDNRPSDEGLGRPVYGEGVHQLVLKAPTQGPPEIWEPTEKLGKLEGLEVAGASMGKGKYWMALRIPRNPEAAANFGFDIGINGPPAHAAGRKTQLMLFGTASNNTNASGFGLGTIENSKAGGIEK